MITHYLVRRFIGCVSLLLKVEIIGMTLLKEVVFEEKTGRTGRLGMILLNRPAVLNATTKQMNLAIYHQLDKWQQDESIKAVIIRGAGDRAFCAGGDIRKLYESGKAGTQYSDEFFLSEYRLNHRIFYFNKPYIAWLNGITMGGGVGISIYGSHRLATEKLMWAMPETRIGYFPDIGASYFLPRCPGKVGFYLGLSGEYIDAHDACYVGIVDAIIASDQLNDFTNALLNADYCKDAYAAVDNVVQSFLMRKKTSHIEKHYHSINRCFDQMSVEAIFNCLEKEKSEWSYACLKLLKQRSPIALKVTLEHLKRGEKLTFDDCMRMDYCVNRHFVKHPDYYEGIRAAIIDKDHHPKWHPSCLEEVSSDDVVKFFTQVDPEISFK